MKTGIVYVATGPRHAAEAMDSAASVKQKMPTMPIAIFTDEDIAERYFERVHRVDDPQHSYIDKILWMPRSPFSRTLFLDTDTYVCKDISEMFRLLDRFDLAAGHASNRISYGSDRLEDISGIPEAFPEMNTGVILFRRSHAVRRFFERWLDCYKTYVGKDGTPRHDQPAFRWALYRSQLHVATLPPEYNCRFNYPVFLRGPARILHGRHPEIPEIARALNERTDRRVFVPGLGLVGHRELG